MPVSPTSAATGTPSGVDRRARRPLHRSCARRMGAGTVLAAALWAGAAHAGGFQLRTGSPDWSANAFAGMAAKAYDASTAWTNPAGMTRLSSSEVDLGINLVATTIQFQGQDLIGGAPVSGSQGGNAGGLNVLPGLEAVWSATPDLKFGLSVEEPFGERTAWSGDFVGRYQALVSSISDTEIGLAVAYRLTPTLSIGGGPIIDHFAARLTSAVNTGPLAALAGDPVADLHGDSWAVGYHLGVLWEPSPSFRAGIDYRSRIGEALSGNQTVAIPALIGVVSPATAGALSTLNQSVHADLALPDVLTLSAAWVVTPGLTALASVQWTHWALFQELTVTSGGAVSSVQQFRNQDSWLFSIGVNERPAALPRWRFQGGLGFERGPIQTADRTPRLPGLDLILLGVGATYNVTRAIAVQAAYLHEFGLADASNSYSATPSAGNLIGSYSVSGDVASLGVTWRF